MNQINSTQVASAQPFVLSTLLLSEKDKRLVKSMCMLLAGRLNKRWLVSADATEGDVLFAYKGREPDAEKFEEIYAFSADQQEQSNCLSYPIRTHQVLEALNRVKLERDEIMQTAIDEDSEFTEEDEE